MWERIPGGRALLDVTEDEDAAAVRMTTWVPPAPAPEPEPPEPAPERQMALVAPRQSLQDRWGVTVSDAPVESSALDPFHLLSVFPLYVHPAAAPPGQLSLWADGSGAAP